MTKGRYLFLLAAALAFVYGLIWTLTNQEPGPVKWHGSSGNYQSQRR